MPSDFGHTKSDPPSAPNATLFADPDEPTGPKYPILRIISVVFKVLAVLAAIIGVINALMTLAVSASMSGSTFPNAPQTGTFALYAMVLSLVYGAVSAICFLAISEGILVFLDIEENSRTTNELLERLVDSSKK